MKKYIFILGIVIASVATSCLKSDLEELPIFDEVEILGIDVEYRYIDTNNNGVEFLVFKVLPTTNEVIDETSGAITLDPLVPAPSGSFTEELRKGINLTNIAVSVRLSPAASIEPLNGAPVLGTTGDFSSPRTYRVTAADGKTTKDWTINIGEFPLINDYEGTYQESGTLVRIGNPADNLDAEVFLSSVNANTVKAQAGTSVFNNPGITFFIQINNDNSVTILSDPDAVVAIMPQDGVASTYDPATKTFDLHYHYRNGERLFDTKLVKL